MKEIKEIESEYNLELNKVISVIKKQKAKIVCIQLPDGLKTQAIDIATFIEQESKAICTLWAGSCFGACDLPPVKNYADILIQFGHTPMTLKNL